MANVRLETLIDITENKSKTDVNEMVNVCKRLNNKKRDYLFVNSFQGKHIPQSPQKILSMFKELLIEVQKTICKDEKILVIGFAETATAIGQYIGNNLDNCVYILQTTREEIDGLNKLIEFEEEHSHAVGQWIYSKEELPEYDRILFVEDEITTGNTIINFIEKFSKINNKTKYAVASILNWQNEECRNIYKEKQIDTYYVVKGNIRENIEPLELEANNEVKDNVKCINKLVSYTLNCNEVVGSVPNKVNMARTDQIAENIKAHIKGNKIAVVGTEEFMYIPLKIAEKLENDFDVKYHATTRSPITISTDKGYAIRSGVELESAYDKDRKTYLYNLGKYDTVIVITNGNITEEFRSQLKFNTEQMIFVKLEG